MDQFLLWISTLFPVLLVLITLATLVSIRVTQRHKYGRHHQRGIMTNAYALLWFFYTLVIWFLTTLYGFAQTIVKAMLTHAHQ